MPENKGQFETDRPIAINEKQEGQHPLTGQRYWPTSEPNAG